MEIECKFKNLEWSLCAPKKVYTCIVTACDITNRGSVVASFKGKHKKLKYNRNVKGLSFRDVEVNHIPKNLTKIFPNLIYLEIDNCKLKEVNADDMIGLENLEDLSLNNNKITNLSSKFVPKHAETQRSQFKQELDIKNQLEGAWFD